MRIVLLFFTALFALPLGLFASFPLAADIKQHCARNG